MTGQPSQAELRGADGRLLVPHLELAESFFSRFRGLMLRAALPAGHGLLIRPCGSIHTCFMRFPIDVIFTDGALTVVDLREHVSPWRLALCLRAEAVIELPAGSLSDLGLTVGEVLRVA